MLSFSVLTPYYCEETVYSTSELEQMSGTTLWRGSAAKERVRFGKVKKTYCTLSLGLPKRSLCSTGN
ncbi:hypothetical protein AQUCO_00100779v1 [Aquilegia coerulea]|uniref:Uncharacterized protein n=1 Tax=Aquilegia coerulea TaxID=218851 RepID=A0A2G5FBW5_AQUCA|nr:hypothetical protein AQUCO_00100779v1 [Aquilegia coerulea]